MDEVQKGKIVTILQDREKSIIWNSQPVTIKASKIWLSANNNIQKRDSLQG
jgi:hypothetical protein